MVLKIFVSIPFEGRTEEQIKDAINIEHSRLVNMFHHYPVEIVTAREVMNNKKSANENFVKAISQLEKCDICALGDGWSYSDECKLEREIAVKFGKPVVITDTEYTPSFIENYIVGKVLSTKHVL